MNDMKGIFSEIPKHQQEQIAGELSSAYIANLQALDVRLLETHPNIVFLESVAYGENDRRLCIVDKYDFVRWLNKVRCVFRDDLGFD